MEFGGDFGGQTSSGGESGELGSLFEWEEHKTIECELAGYIHEKGPGWQQENTPHTYFLYMCHLEDDIARIDQGLVPLPMYAEEGPAAQGPQAYTDADVYQMYSLPRSEGSPMIEEGASVLIEMPIVREERSPSKPHKKAKHNHHSSNTGGGSGTEKRKGVPWTEEEHKLFLVGLAKHGKGDWRSIARNYVISRTPTQVASHAQKYFIRLNSCSKKDKRRASIHDITSATIAGDAEYGYMEGDVY